MCKVKIFVPTFNLKDYIKQCLDSILNQKTNFDFQIIIGDDASTDGTQDILRLYKEKYPNKIDLRISEKNLGVLANSNRILDKIDSEYFGVLDGDDFWLDDNHLQKQVDFLDKNKKFTICSANTQYIEDGNKAGFVLQKDEVGKSYSFSDYLNNQLPYIHVSSILFRNIIYNKGLPDYYFSSVDTWENCACRGDSIRFIEHLEFGDAFVMNYVNSCYRIHSCGVWQGASSIHRKIEDTIMQNFLFKIYKNKYKDIFIIKIKDSYRELVKTLIFEEKILTGYNLCEKDSYLLTNLFLDLSKSKILETKLNRHINLIKKLEKLVLNKLLLKY